MFFLYLDYYSLLLYVIGIGLLLGMIAFRKNFTYLSGLQKVSVVFLLVGILGIMGLTILTQFLWSHHM